MPPFRMALMHPVQRDELVRRQPRPTWPRARRPGPAGRPGAHGGPLGHARCEPGRAHLSAAGRRGRRRFGGVMAQSGSFFTSDLDPQESSYPFFDRVTAAVREVEQPDHTDRPLQIAMTCGRLEENFANNDAMASPWLTRGTWWFSRPSRTCTTTRPGATPWTRPSPTSCAQSGHRWQSEDCPASASPTTRWRTPWLRPTVTSSDCCWAWRRTGRVRSRRSPDASASSSTQGARHVDRRRAGAASRRSTCATRRATSSSSTGWRTGTTTRASG